MKADITTEEDIRQLVDRFYTKIRENETLGYIFDDVANVNWDQHLPVMYKFWASALLDAQSYRGSPLDKHIALSKITPMTEKEFFTWIPLFKETVDELFQGAVAEDAKARGEQIARVMLHAIQMDAR